MAAYSTRLLVLGVVKIFGPAHGYPLMRELQSWEVDTWADIKPGSVYSLLRTLTKSGLVREIPAKSTAKAKALYEITDAGENEFYQILREALVDVEAASNATVMGALAFFPYLSRDETVELLERRREQLLRRIQEQVAGRDYLNTHPQLAPPHVNEHFFFKEEHYRGQLSWVDSVLARIRSGAYSFLGEKAIWEPPNPDPIWGERS